jgi:hypothetical protein
MTRTWGVKDNKMTTKEIREIENLRHSTWFPHNGKLIYIANRRSHLWSQDHGTNTRKMIDVPSRRGGGVKHVKFKLNNNGQTNTMSANKHKWATVERK